MLKKLLIINILSLSVLYADFIGLDPQQLQKKIDQNVVVIDIRTPPEWIQTSLIPTSKKIMFFDARGAYDVKSWMDQFSKYVKNQDQEFVLVCRSGNRTGTVGNFLSEKLNYKKVYHLKNGIKSWIKENRKVVK